MGAADFGWVAAVMLVTWGLLSSWVALDTGRFLRLVTMGRIRFSKRVILVYRILAAVTAWGAFSELAHRCW